MMKRSSPDNISTALNILKDLSESLENVPYIKTIAGISVQILEIRSEISKNEELCCRIIDNVATRSTALVKALIRAQEDSGLSLQDLTDDLKRYEHLLVEIHQGLIGLTRSKLGWFKAIAKRDEIQDKLERYLARLSEFDATFTFSRLTSLEVNLRRVVERDESTSFGLIDGLGPPAPTIIFTGREDILDRMQSYFSASGQQRIFVLYGLGGSGKTQVALKFIEQQKQRWTKIFFVHAGSIEDLNSSFEKIGSSARLRANGLVSVLRWLENLHEEWLLFFDNADDPSIHLRKFIPQCSHGNILITSRNPQTRLLAPESHYHIAALPADVAYTLLLRSSMLEAEKDDEKNAAESLVKELGYLALAIVQAGSFISASPTLSFHTYLHLYKDNRAHFLKNNPGQGVDNYEGTVYTTWEMSFQKLSDTAARLLQICAFWDPSFIILRTILVAATSTLKLGHFSDTWSDATDFVGRFTSTTGGIWNELAFQDVIRELSSFSLITLYDGLVHSLDPLITSKKEEEPSRYQSRSEDQGVYSIHPLVHAWARDRSSPEVREQFKLLAGRILGLALVIGDEELSMMIKRSVTPQVREWLHNAGTEKSNAPPLDQDLWHRFAEVYSEVGWWKEAETLHVSLLAVTGDNEPKRLESMQALGLIYQQQRRWNEAEKHEEEVIQLSKKLYGEEDHRTLAAMSRLASIYANQNALDQAVELESEVFETSKRIYGERDRSTLASMSNLGLRYSTQKRWTEAEQLQTSAVDLMKTVFGERHPQTLAALHNLAATYCSQSRWLDALGMQVVVAQTRAGILGWDHPDTILSFEHLASTYCDLELWDEAEPFQTQVVAHLNEVVGCEDSRTLVAKSNMAVIWFKLDKSAEAEQILVDVVDVKKRVFGEEHPSTAASIAALENVRRAKEDSSEHP